MNNSIMTKFSFIAAAIALLSVFMAAPAGAGDLNWKLKGDYTWNSTGTCASASCGFDTTQQIPGPKRNLGPCTGPGPGPVTIPGTGISYNYTIQGEFSFDGQGNFDFRGETLSIMLEPYRSTPEPATSGNFTSPIHHVFAEGTGTYIVDLEADELFVEIKFNSFKSGPYVFTGATFRGRLTPSSVGSVVFLSTTSPIPEDVDSLYPATFPLPPNLQRICNATGSMVKLSPGRNWFSKE